MTELLVRDRQRHEELTERLSKTIFQSPRAFIEAHSEGLINRNNDDVKAIADEIVDIYQNVEMKNRELVFVSQTEVMTEELLEGLQDWKIITKLKRALSDALEENILTTDTIYFLPDSVGYVYADNSDGEQERLLSEKFFNATKALEPIYKRYSSFSKQTPAQANFEPQGEGQGLPDVGYGEGESEEEKTDAYVFKVEDILDIDDSFIESIYRLFEQNS